MKRLRRRALIAGLGVWAGTASAQEASDGELVGGDQAVPLGKVPFRLEGGIVFDISINDAPPAPFLLATRMAGTVVDAAFAAGLRLDEPDVRKVQAVVAGRSSTAEIGQVRMRANGVALPAQYVSTQVLSNRLADRGWRPRLAGLIGLGGVGAPVIRINWPTAILELLPTDAQAAAGSVSLQLAGGTPIIPNEGIRASWRFPTVAAVLDGVPADLAIGTGFGGIVELTAEFVTRNNLLQRYGKHIDFDAPSQFTGQRPISLAIARRLELGGAAIDTPRIAMARAPETPERLTAGNPESRITAGYSARNRFQLPTPPAVLSGVLGLGTLRRFIPFLDVNNYRLVLEPLKGKSPPPPPGTWRSAGLSLDKPARDHFSIISVIPDTPASRAGISESDKIIAVNGIAASDLALFDYWRLEAAGPLAIRFDTGAVRTIGAVSLLP